MTAPAALRHVRFHHAGLRDARRSAGLTIDDAGAALGCSGSIIARYERGVVSPQADVIAALCALYGADPADLWLSIPQT